MSDTAFIDAIRRHGIPAEPLERSGRYEVDLPETHPTGV